MKFRNIFITLVALCSMVPTCFGAAAAAGVGHEEVLSVNLIEGCTGLRSMSLSRDKKHALIVQGGSASLYDVETGDQTKNFGHCECASLSPDGKYVVMGRDAHQLNILRAIDGAYMGGTSDSPHTDRICSIEFSPEDSRKFVVASYDGTASTWIIPDDGTASTWILSAERAAKGAILESCLTGHAGPVYSALFSPCGCYILTASEDCTAKIWSSSGLDIGQCKKTLDGFTEPVLNVSWSPDGKKVATALRNGAVAIFDTSNIKVIEKFKSDICSSPYVTDQVDLTSAWDAAVGCRIVTLETPRDAIYSVSFSSDGTKVVTSHLRCAIVWDASTGRRLKTLVGHTDEVYLAVFSSRDERVLTASKDGTVKAWDIKPRSCVVQ